MNRPYLWWQPHHPPACTCVKWNEGTRPKARRVWTIPEPEPAEPLTEPQVWNVLVERQKAEDSEYALVVERLKAGGSEQALRETRIRRRRGRVRLLAILAMTALAAATLWIVVSARLGIPLTVI